MLLRYTLKNIFFKKKNPSRKARILSNAYLHSIQMPFFNLQGLDIFISKAKVYFQATGGVG